ncbi:DUF6377 domain-containing protein [Sphingobacterium chuzhouense]|uniref:DUF6377 domain-containing protein n=1 Tax=Sphingobacterium chuzhouense TaxID=1742264 RepID=A0ABR7XLW6_9SPHI|nr:DUF6377 domain-containing protein [Sphingobacterium chuzhouense]MBD1420144.1 hypothetical protein [Sphingobacterium chuzhouense]
MAENYISKKNRTLFSVFISAVILLLTSQCSSRDSSEKSLETLNQVIADREYYLEKKLSQIDSVRKKLHSTTDGVAQFDAYRTLFHMYYDLQIDTALQYAEQMLRLSESVLKSQPTYQTESLLLTARVYAYTGMYKECGELLDKEYFLKEELSEDLKRLYFVTQMELYKGLADQAIIERELKAYDKIIDASRDSLITIIPKNSVWHLIHLSNKIKVEGDYDRAVEVLSKAYNQLTTDDRDMAHVAFYMSDLYRLKGDGVKEKQYLIISSITDVKHAVKEYVSLWKLAEILYNEGNVKTAYQFIEISLQDAMYSGAYRWTQHIIKILPSIYASYNTKILQQKNTISSAFFVIVCLLACSILLSLYIVRQYRKLDRAKGQLSKMNDDLMEMNEELNALSDKLHLANIELETTNSQLLFVNSELVSTNLLKETYLSKFIDLCSDYIDKLDEYRGSLKRLLKGGKLDKIEKELASTKYIDNEHKAFLTNFDETFLNLYPNFVSEFNSLFPQDEQQRIKHNELLTTELRVFALIRLGITDSYKIAKFLRCSITTIYTYRSKMKNKSYYPDSFEDRIKEHRKQAYFSLIKE